MTTKELQIEKIEMTITGSIFDKIVLLGYAERFAQRMGLNPTAVVNEMTASSDENFFKTFSRYFGDYFRLTFVY